MLVFLAGPAENAGARRTAAAIMQGKNTMRKLVRECLMCLGLSSLMLVAQGCMIGGGHGGGGGGQGIPGATLTSLSPSSVPAGSPPFTLTVNGSGFVAGGSLSWNGTTPLGQYTFVSSTQVTVQIGAGLIMSPGSGVIVATIPTPRRSEEHT